MTAQMMHLIDIDVQVYIHSFIHSFQSLNNSHVHIAHCYLQHSHAKQYTSAYLIENLNFFFLAVENFSFIHFMTYIETAKATYDTFRRVEQGKEKVLIFSLWKTDNEIYHQPNLSGKVTFGVT